MVQFTRGRARSEQLVPTDQPSNCRYRGILMTIVHYSSGFILFYKINIQREFIKHYIKFILRNKQHHQPMLHKPRQKYINLQYYTLNLPILIQDVC